MGCFYGGGRTLRGVGSRFSHLEAKVRCGEGFLRVSWGLVWLVVVGVEAKWDSGGTLADSKWFVGWRGEGDGITGGNVCNTLGHFVRS